LIGSRRVHPVRFLFAPPLASTFYTVYHRRQAKENKALDVRQSRDERRSRTPNPCTKAKAFPVYHKLTLPLCYILYRVYRCASSLMPSYLGPQTAIAAAINLRCFAHLSRRPDHKLSLDLPDIGLVREWDIDQLPWAAFTARPVDDDGHAPAELDSASFASVEKFLTDDGLGSTAHAAALAIIYVYMTIGNKQERYAVVSFKPIER